MLPDYNPSCRRCDEKGARPLPSRCIGFDESAQDGHRARRRRPHQPTAPRVYGLRLGDPDRHVPNKKCVRELQHQLARLSSSTAAFKLATKTAPPTQQDLALNCFVTMQNAFPIAPPQGRKMIFSRAAYILPYKAQKSARNGSQRQLSVKSYAYWS